MRNKSGITKALILFVAVLFATCAAAPLTHAANLAAGPAEKVKYFKTDAAPYDFTYGEWSAKWWQWALSIPLIDSSTGLPQHPLFLDGAENCGVGQSGKVWFLGGRFCETGKPCPASDAEERSCTIPKGTALFIPIVNGEDSFLEETELGGSNLTIDAMRGYLAAFFGTVEQLKLEVDGVLVEDVQNFRVKSPVFDFTLPQPYFNGEPDNIFTAIEPGNYPAGTYTQQAVGDGYCVMLKPLPAGTHTIRFGGAVPTGDGNFFIINTTYRITVQ